MSETTTTATPTPETASPNDAAETPKAYTAAEALAALNETGKQEPEKEEPEAGATAPSGAEKPGGGEEAPKTGAGEGEEHPAPVRDLSDLPEGAKVKFGDVEVSVDDIKALNSRDTALTQRATALSAQEDKLTSAIKANRDQMQAVTDKAAARFQTLSDNYEEARTRFASDPAGLTRYENELRAAYADMTAAKERFDGLDAEAKGRDEAAFKERLNGMAKYLMDPATGIKGYDQSRHDSNAKFAASMGVPEAALGDLTDGPAWRLIDMARRYSEGTEAAQKVRATPATQSAKPAIRERGDNSTAGSAKAQQAKAAEQRFKASGSQKDAIAFLDAQS